jgi:peroxiredoxin
MSSFCFSAFLSPITFAFVWLTANVALSQTDVPVISVPQNLLKLVHAPEVQAEIGLNDDERLLTILRDIDRIWWPARILPETKQVETIRGLEEKLLDSLKPLLTPAQFRRLREIEAQSQGTRVLIRPEVAKAIGLDDQQRLTIKNAFLATDTATRALAAKQGGDADLEKKLQSARAEEKRVINDVLGVANRQALGKLIGEPFDTSSLRRIYPLAPELIDSNEWAGSGPVTLESQRGKVVLVHFYAFQCHNCVANFEHYKRWHEMLSQRGVTVVGIQTPETPAERDPALVKQAAAKKGFEFPVLIDLESANWNAWGNTMWPTIYVIDKKGYIRFWWQGELNWQGATGDKSIEKLVDELLAENGSSSSE